MKYDVDYFIEKFETIPEDKWIAGTYLIDSSNKIKQALGLHDYRCCAQGHCVTPQNAKRIMKEYSRGTAYNERRKHPELMALCDLFGYTGKNNNEIIVADINNGRDSRYKQNTPKQRVLAALRDLKREHTFKPTYELKPVLEFSSNN